MRLKIKIIRQIEKLEQFKIKNHTLFEGFINISEIKYNPDLKVLILIFQVDQTSIPGIVKTSIEYDYLRIVTNSKNYKVDDIKKQSMKD